MVTLDGKSATFPLRPLDELPAGEYTVQAVFAFNRDVNLPDAPGNRYCDPVKVKLDPKAGTIVKLTLDKTYEEEVPAETATHKYLKLPSKLLSDFHGRPMVYRVGVVLPPNFETRSRQEVRPARPHRRVRHPVHRRRGGSPRTRGSCKSCSTGPGRSATRTR